MEEIYLVFPQIQHKEMVLNYKAEHFKNNEDTLCGSSMLDGIEKYEEWLDFVSNSAKVAKGWVQSSTFLVMNEKKDLMIGIVDIRHELNEGLRKCGGHIGFGVRPSLRRKGFATAILKEALSFCAKLGLEKVMISCNKKNIASRKTILRCGGELEKEVCVHDELMQIYWIEVPNVNVNITD